MARNGSDFVTNWMEAQNAPEGAQVAYLQDYGSMSQTLYLDAGTYQTLVPGRPACDLPDALSGNRGPGRSARPRQRDTIDPVNTLYGSYQSSTFTVTTAGAHTIEFLGVDPLGGDNTAFIDQVTLSANAINNGSFETPALDPASTFSSRPPARPGSSRQRPAWTAMAAAYTSGNPNAPDGTRSPSSRERQHEPIRQPDCRHVRHLVRRRPACQRPAPEPANPGLLDGTASHGLITPVGTTLSSLRERRISRSRPECTPSSSLA